MTSLAKVGRSLVVLTLGLEEPNSTASPPPPSACPFLPLRLVSRSLPHTRTAAGAPRRLSGSYGLPSCWWGAGVLAAVLAQSSYRETEMPGVETGKADKM